MTLLTKAAERPLLEFVGDSAHQEITGQPHGRRCPMQPPPLAAQFEDRRGGKAAPATPISIDDLAMSATEIVPNEPESRRNALAHAADA
jgi:hypothetical protein